MSFEIRGLNPEERKYTYTQSQQINMQTGCIGHLRAQVEEYGAFPSSWDDHHGNQKTQVFKDELDIVINSLRFGTIYVDKHDNIIIRKIRQGLGLTQKQYAQRLGVPLKKKKKWEQNRVRINKSTWEKYFR